MRTLCLFAVTIALTLSVLPVLDAEQRASSPPPPTEKLPQGNIQHGRYLAEHVAMCIECHSMRDANGVIVEGAEYLGGEIPFAPPWPNNWAMRAPRNRGLVGYDDKAALRLLTQGAIGRDGKPLRRPMPRFFMTPQDAADVIAYLRSLN